MEENILLPENSVPLGETKLVSDPSPLVIESSPNLADLRPVQFSLNGLPETKANTFDKMDIDNHNVTVDNSTDSEIQHVETTDTNSLSNKSISEDSETNTQSAPCESVSEPEETTNRNSISNVSDPEHSERADRKPLPHEDVKSVSNSPQITPGQSRYGRIRRPKLSVDFVLVDKKSFAVLNSSSYDFVHAAESRPVKTPVVKKKRSYVRKSYVLSKDDSLPATPNNTLPKSEQDESSKPETGESKTKFSITNSDVCSLDESSVSSLNSSIIKTYSRLSETGLSSDDKQSGTEENADKEPMPVNYTELNWKVGDIAWAKVGCYPYWPSIVTLESGSSIYAKSVGKRGNRLALHVQFFGDRGRRSWVLTTSLIKYESREQFLELKRQYKKDKMRNKYFNVIRMKELWDKAIAEADTILKMPHEERIQYYQSIYPQSEELYVAKAATKKVKSATGSARKNPEERRGRKRKILDDESAIKKKKLENLSSISATQRGSVLIRRGRGRPPKKLVSSMVEHLRKRRAFEKRLKKIMTPSDDKPKTKAGVSPKSQSAVNKFDQLIKDGKTGGAVAAQQGEPKKKDALSVYDFESDEETDVFLGTYNSRYTPHLLAKIEEKKSDEVAETPNCSTEASSSLDKSSEENETDENLEKDGVGTNIEPKAMKEESSAKIDAEVTPNDTEITPNDTEITPNDTEITPKRGRGRPKGSKNVKTLLRLQALEKTRGRSRLIKNQAQEKILIRRKKKALLKAESNVLKKHSSASNDGSDSTSEQKKKVHPKKRLLEKSRHSEKIPKIVSAENVEENDKTLPDENVKPNKLSPSMSPKEDLESDDDELKVIQPDTEEEKCRSSSPQPIPYKSKKSSALFSGYRFEKVCLICEKAGDTVRCRGPCSGTYHIECACPDGVVEMKKVEVVENGAPCKPRRGRPPRASSTNLVSASESEEGENPIGSLAGSNKNQSDPAIDQCVVDSVANENGSSALSVENNVTATAEETASSKVDNFGVSTNDGISNAESESVSAEYVPEKENGVLTHDKASTQVIAALVPSLETQEMNIDDHPTDETLPTTELTNSVMENDHSEVSLMNGHCDLSDSGSAIVSDEVTESVNEATKNHLVEEKTESSNAQEITREQENISVVAKYQNEEIEEFSSIKEVPDDGSIHLNKTCSLDKDDQTVDDSVTSSENTNEQVEEQRVPYCVEADRSVENQPDSSSMSDNEAVDRTAAQSRLEVTNESTSDNVDEILEEPSSSTANDQIEDQENRDHQVEEESCVANVSHHVDEPDSCCDSINRHLEEDAECCVTNANRPVERENVCDIVNKDESSAVSVSLLENEEAVSSDGCSEHLSCSTKTDNSNGIDFRCARCSENKLYPCFTCGQDVEEKTGETERYSCYLSSCGRVYHKECLKAWPQATWKGNISGRLIRNGSSVSRNAVVSKETLLCPQHYCHTCISENPAVHKNRHCNEILVRCIRCPTAYHRRVHCIPAGTEILTMSQIICPRHYEPPVGAKYTLHFNTSWCFICCIGGSLICCDECPTSFHAECLQLRPEEYEGRYICDDCQSGRYLLYGDIAWVKLGHYRWWPAKILYPNEVPDNIRQLPHARGEFVVQFYGSHNYNWVNRGRAFLYQEGDSGKKSCGRSAVNVSFLKAIQEAEEAYQKLKIFKAARDEEARLGWKPPKYVHIKANKPVGNVRIVELNSSNITPCECDPQSERPCGPDSDCINRMLLVECNPLICPAGDRCYNQMFEKRIYPSLMPYNTDKRGWGLKTLVDMKKGDFIIEYVGEMIDEEEYKRRVNIMHKNQEDNYYFLTIDKDRMLDAGPKGNVARFMNHSCDPNCETQKWTVNGDTRVGLFALKDIPANTELVFNYNLATQGNEMKPCFCGSEKCSGFIGVKAVKNGGLSVEDEQRKRSEDESDLPSKKKVKRGRGRPRKKIRKLFLTTDVSKPSDEKLSTDVPQSVVEPKIKKKKRKKIAAKKVVNRFKKWSVADPRSKTKSRITGIAKKNVESLLKHREQLKQRAQDATKATSPGEKVVTPPKERKVEHRGRPKTPKTEEEKQALIFEMMRKRIQRKIEEMTLCKLDEKCFVCGESQEDEELLFCDNNKCPKGYHLHCVNLAKWPSGRWLCPWHYCTLCRSIRKVLKCDICTASYCPEHVSENLYTENNGRYFCEEHRTSSSEPVRVTPKLEKEIVEPTEAPTTTPKSGATPTPESGAAPTPPAKRPRGRPKGSKAVRRVVEPTVAEEASDVLAAKRIKKLSAKMAEANGVAASTYTLPLLPKAKRKILTKRRRPSDQRPSPTDEPARKKFKKKAKKLPNGDLEAAGRQAAGQLVVEANVKFAMMGGRADGAADERLSDEERPQATAPAKANANDSDESFSSYVASEVLVVDEVSEASVSQEASELSDAAGADEHSPAAETSDDEYVNLEVEVVNGDDEGDDDSN